MNLALQSHFLFKAPNWPIFFFVWQCYHAVHGTRRLDLSNVNCYISTTINILVLENLIWATLYFILSGIWDIYLYQYDYSYPQNECTRFLTLDKDDVVRNISKWNLPDSRSQGRYLVDTITLHCVGALMALIMKIL